MAYRKEFWKIWELYCADYWPNREVDQCPLPKKETLWIFDYLIKEINDLRTREKNNERNFNDAVIIYKKLRSENENLRERIYKN